MGKSQEQKEKQVAKWFFEISRSRQAEETGSFAWALGILNKRAPVRICNYVSLGFKWILPPSQESPSSCSSWEVNMNMASNWLITPRVLDQNKSSYALGNYTLNEATAIQTRKWSSMSEDQKTEDKGRLDSQGLQKTKYWIQTVEWVWLIW
jgi:hypothetical protein